MALDLVDYSYELVRHCYCDGSGELIHVDVRDGDSVSAYYATEFSSVESPRGWTVPELYDLIQSAIQDDKTKAIVSFSEDGSIPTRILLKHSTAMDANLTLILSDFRSMQ